MRSTGVACVPGELLISPYLQRDTMVMTFWDILHAKFVVSEYRASLDVLVTSDALLWTIWQRDTDARNYLEVS